MKTWSDPRYANIEKGISKEIMDHHVKERQSRSFDFRTPSAGSMWAFALTWTPGSMILTGDLGEMQITHYHALMGTALESFRWITECHPDYLLGKAGVQKVFDREATLESFEAECREDFTKAVKHYREHCHDVRPEDIKRKHQWAWLTPNFFEEYWDDAFRNLDDYRKAFTFESREAIKTSAGRARIRADIREFVLEHDHHELCQALSEAGVEEYYSYGVKKWDHSAISQITAIQHGARMAVKILKQEHDFEIERRKAEVASAWVNAGMPKSGKLYENFLTAYGSILKEKV